ncbi:MAG: glycosyltransferase [Halieaceae bacterium]
MNKKKLLFVTPQLPQPIREAADNASWQVLALLAEEYEVTLACPLAEGEEGAAAELREQIRVKHSYHQAYDLQSEQVSSAGISHNESLQLRLSAALARQVEQLADDHDLLVIDHFVAFYYLPETFSGTKVYNAHAAHFDRHDKGPDARGKSMNRVFDGMEAQYLRKREVQGCTKVDLVFAQPADAAALSDAGVPFGKLYFSMTSQKSIESASAAPSFNKTNKRLGYVGYLGDEKNVSSLLWFINTVWPIALQQHPDLELHLVGKDPDLRLLSAAMDYPGISFHTSKISPDLEPLDCRIAIDPLVYEDHAEAKLVNAMARGVPTLTTRMGTENSTFSDGDGVLVSDGPRHMASQIDKLLTDKPLWTKLCGDIEYLVQERLPHHQTFYSMRRAFDRVSGAVAT